MNLYRQNRLKHPVAKAYVNWHAFLMAKLQSHTKERLTQILRKIKHREKRSLWDSGANTVSVNQEKRSFLL